MHLKIQVFCWMGDSVSLFDICFGKHNVPLGSCISEFGEKLSMVEYLSFSFFAQCSLCLATGRLGLD